MIRNFVLAAALLLAAVIPSYARNLAIPAKNPAVTIVIPDSWDIEETDYGYSVTSPDEDVVFSIEAAGGARVEKMLEANDQWMKDQEIVAKGKPVEEKLTISGIPATLYTYEATDPDGDTIIDFVVLPAGNGRVMLLTLWASKEARDENDADIGAMMSSFKAIN